MRLLALFLLLSLPFGAWASAEESLRRAKDFFEYGEYAQALALAEDLLARNVLADDEALIDANRIAGLAHFYGEADDRLKQAERYFLQVLSIEPDYRLDPFFTPPAAVEFFDSVRAANEAQLAPIREQRRRAKEARRAEEEARRHFLAERARAAAAEGEESEVATIERRHFALIFLPLGAGQFQNGDTTKGVTLAAVQAISGIASLGSWALVESLRGDQGGFSRRNIDRAQTLDRVKWISAAVFYSAWAYGIADAWIHFEPVVPVDAPPAGKAQAAGWAPHLAVDEESVALGFHLQF